MTGAGIVLFNPSIQRLKENLDAITVQVDFTVLIDNGSNNLIDIKKLLSCYSNIELIENNKNLGIAKALNQIVEVARNKGVKWVLTLDQDTVCRESLIAQYQQFVCLDNVASLTCEIEDRNFSYSIYDSSNANYTIIDKCITSGNYINIDAWAKIGGFDESFFIDSVDTDFCYRLLQAGYKIVRIPFPGILHEVGYNTKRRKLFGKEIVVFNHSPFRCYYLVRNQIYFGRKHQKSLGWRKALRYRRTAWTRIIVYLLFEENKMKKMKAWIKGLIDGYRMQVKNVDD